MKKIHIPYSLLLVVLATGLNIQAVEYSGKDDRTQYALDTCKRNSSTEEEYQECVENVKKVHPGQVQESD